MANIYPNSVTYYDTGSEGERKVYDALKKKLSDEWIVIHSLRWVEKVPTKKNRAQGEGDFIIMHPDFGILVIEVKGGDISFENRIWSSVDGRGIKHRIKDPEKQASDTKFELLQTLKQRDIPDCFICHAVWFPDVDTRFADLPSQLSEEIVLDTRALVSPEQCLKEAFSFWYKRLHWRQRSLDRATLLQIEKVLNPTLRLVKILKRQSEDINEIFVRLNDEQFRLLENLEQCPHLSVVGRAGTGKTLLAIEKARRDSEKGKKVLFLCFNRQLADRIKENSDHQFDTFTIHSFALHYMNTFYPARALGFNGENFDYLLEEFLEVVDQPQLIYDSIIIDEGQDFQPSWIKGAQQMLRAEGHFYTFYDPMQEVYSVDLKQVYDYLHVGPVITLKRNMRNTDEISHGTLNVINVAKDDSYFNGVKGRTPDVFVCKNTADVIEAYRKTVHQLTTMDYIAEANITTVTLTSTKNNPFIKEAEPHIRGELTSVRRFKGLENDVVIIVDANLSFLSDPVRQKLLYVAISRARVHVILFFTIDQHYKTYMMNQWNCTEGELEGKVKALIFKGIENN